MSGTQGAWNHAWNGEFLTAAHDIWTWAKNRIAGAPLWVKTFLGKGGSDELAILESLIPVAVKDVKDGGFTTDSFINAAKDVLAQLVAKNITAFSFQNVLANLNMAVDADPDAQAALQAAKGLLGIASIQVPASEATTNVA